MSVSADLASARLSVLLDIRHPLAYLALRPARRFGQELGVAVNWLPLASQPLKPPSMPGPDDDRSVLHRRHRARMIAREIAVYADAQGLEIREPYRSGPAEAAHLAWLWVRDRAPASLPDFLEELFRRYWALELDAGDPTQAADFVKACGLDADEFRRFASGDGPAVAERIAAEIAEAGVFQVPAYVVGDEVFYGRQHLPMIRWLLEGRRGPVPI